MKTEILKLLECPNCSGDIHIKDTQHINDEEEIIDGSLVCLDCNLAYKVANGIPRFVASEQYADSFGFQWNKFKDEQIDTANGASQSERRFLSETKWETAWMQNKLILDVGCGAGRFLEVASRNPENNVIGVDLSNSVDAARLTLASRKNVTIIQASIYALPFKKEIFDGVYCIGVIQHTPDPKKSIMEITDMVTKGGKLALTIYEKRLFTTLNGKYLLRPITRRINNRILLSIIRVLMPLLWPITEVLFRIPKISKVFKFIIPVANYVDDHELSWRQRYNWAIMDTFDALSPAYDYPQSESDVITTLMKKGMRDIQRDQNILGVNVTAEK
jgi:SAM-dependent methyltransferase